MLALGLVSRIVAASRCSRWIYRKAATNILVDCHARGVSTAGAVSDESVVHCCSKISMPWLMLPPAFEEGVNMVYKFYNLAEDKVVSLNNEKKRDGREEKDSSVPDDDAELVGSSHGWLALLNKRNSDLFLFNPLSHRHIKLPPINTLPIPEGNLLHGIGVKKLIISCDPASSDCRVMILFGPASQLAFCCSGYSTEWTPISTENIQYMDLVYSNKQKLFFCVQDSGWHFQAWDLQDPQSPRLIPMVFSVEKYYFTPSIEELKFEEFGEWWSIKFLVVGEHSDDFFLVKRYTLRRVGPDGSSVEPIYYGMHVGYDDTLPYKTCGFDVYKYDLKERELKYMDSSLDGLAFFIGYNHGFALSCAGSDFLKPNSIYFTDVNRTPPNPLLHDWDVYKLPYGGHDIGIFDYVNRTFSPCYYPCDAQSIKRIEPAPMWFTPSQPYEEETSV